MRRIILVTALALCVANPACIGPILAGPIDLSGLGSSLDFSPAFEFAQEEHCWRIDGEHDTVEWIEILHGLKGPIGCKEQLDLVLAGRRVFPPGGGIAVDLDDLGGGDGEQTKTLRALAPSLRVEERRLVLDESGEPTLWRRMRIEQTSQWLDFLSAGLASSAASEPGKPTEVWPGIAVGALSLEQVREYRNNGGKACRLDGHEFVVELPMTTSDAARCIESLASASTSAEFDGGFLRVRYRPDASGWMRSRLYTFGTAPTSHHHDPIDVVALDVRPEPIDMYRRLRAEHGLR